MDSRLAAALELQLSDWRAALCAGAQRVGWKLGMGDRERIGDGPVIGHLTSESRLPPGGVYRGPGVTSDPRCRRAACTAAPETTWRRTPRWRC